MIIGQNTLTESERLQTALDAAGVGVWDLDLVKNELVWSLQCYRLFGITTPHPINYNTFLSGLHPDDRERTDQVVQNAFKPESGGTYDIEYRTVGLEDGITRWVRATGKAYFDNEGKAYRFIGTLTDISSQKAAEAQMQESEQRFRTMADSAPVMIWITNQDGYCHYLNQRWLNYTGQSLEQGLGIGWADAVHPDDRIKTKEAFLLSNSEKKEFRVEYRLRRKDGLYRWMLDSALPRFDESGRYLGYIGSVLDISDRKQAEEELQFRMAQLEAQNEASPLGILVIDQDRRVNYFNKGYIQLFDLPQEVVDKPYRENLMAHFEQTIINFDQFVERVNYLYTNLVEGSTDELHLTNGKVIERYGYPIRSKDGRYFGWTWQFRDITKERRHQEQLEEKNHQLETLIQEFKFVTDFMPQMVWATKADGYHDFYNKQWYDYTGLDYETTKDKGWSLVLHPDDFDRTWKVWRHSLDTGDIYQIEYRMRRYDGTYRWFLGRAIPMRNEAGDIVKWFGTCTDIDDQRRASELLEQKVAERTQDLQQANQDLERSNAELEQFAYVASHDLQEPLRKIRTFTNMLEGELQKQNLAKAHSYVDRIWQSSSRMQELIRDLLDFSRLNRNDAATYEIVDLNAVAHTILNDLELAISQKGAQVHIQPLPAIEANALQMSQLFYNLLSNALKFTKEGVPPVIEISCAAATPQVLAAHHLEGRDIPFFHFRFADNGIGFLNEYAQQIFTIFQRLHNKSTYEGTGIGLALCKKVVLNHHGAIFAEGEEGKGAVFNVLLPARQTAIA